jgi:predicted RNA-binding Zn-ribbon protein involved in translation (DUF1610 family)
MDEAPALHSCPTCGSEDTPTLVIRAATLSDRGSSWRCRSCAQSWAEPEDRTLVGL